MHLFVSFWNVETSQWKWGKGTMMTLKTSCTLSNMNTNFEHLLKVGTFRFKVNDHYPSTKTRTNCRKKINENYEDWLHICEDYFNYEKWLEVMLLKTDRYFSLYLPNTQPPLEETFIFPFHETCLLRKGHAILMFVACLKCTASPCYCLHKIFSM